MLPPQHLAETLMRLLARLGFNEFFMQQSFLPDGSLNEALSRHECDDHKEGECALYTVLQKAKTFGLRETLCYTLKSVCERNLLKFSP